MTSLAVLDIPSVPADLRSRADVHAEAYHAAAKDRAKRADDTERGIIDRALRSYLVLADREASPPALPHRSAFERGVLAALDGQPQRSPYTRQLNAKNPRKPTWGLSLDRWWRAGWHLARLGVDTGLR